MKYSDYQGCSSFSQNYIDGVNFRIQGNGTQSAKLCFRHELRDSEIKIPQTKDSCSFRPQRMQKWRRAIDLQLSVPHAGDGNNQILRQSKAQDLNPNGEEPRSAQPFCLAISGEHAGTDPIAVPPLINLV